MNTKYEERLGSAKMLPLMFQMALPAMLAQLVNMLYSVVDRIYIGRIPEIGTMALAGIGVTAAVTSLIGAFSQFVASGGAPLAAMALGQGDRDRAHRILGNGVMLLIVFSIGSAVLTYFFMEPILLLTGASENTLGYAMEYLQIYLMGTIFVQFAIGLNTYINCQGRPTIAMASVLIGAVLNIILDPIFIFGFDMGVRGAALATVLAQACSAIWVVGFLTSAQASLRIKREYLKLEPQIIMSVCALGISPFVMACTESLIGFVLNGSLAKFGDIYVSALTIMQSTMLFIGVPLLGFAQGFIPIISYNYGQHNVARVREAVKYALLIMFFGNLVGTLASMVFAGQIATIFTSDAALVEVVSKMMPLFLAGMLVFGLQRACQNIFLAMGQAKVSLFIALLRKVFLLVPFAIYLSRYGYAGVYGAEALADAIAAITCIVIFAFRFPGLMRRIEEPVETEKQTL